MEPSAVLWRKLTRAYSATTRAQRVGESPRAAAAGKARGERSPRSRPVHCGAGCRRGDVRRRWAGGRRCGPGGYAAGRGRRTVAQAVGAQADGDAGERWWCPVDDGRSGDAIRASRRGRPSQTRAATQSRTGTSPGRARQRRTSSSSCRPRRTVRSRPASSRRANRGLRSRRRRASPRREGRAGRSTPPRRRGTWRACET